MTMTANRDVRKTPAEKARARRILKGLYKHYPDAHCELDYRSPHEFASFTFEQFPQLDEDFYNDSEEVLDSMGFRHLRQRPCLTNLNFDGTGFQHRKQSGRKHPGRNGRDRVIVQVVQRRGPAEQVTEPANRGLELVDVLR